MEIPDTYSVETSARTWTSIGVHAVASSTKDFGSRISARTESRTVGIVAEVQARIAQRGACAIMPTQVEGAEG